jgi:hypothetical protein
MKVLLNYGVYAKRDAPTFAAADMDKVISLADEIINSGSIHSTQLLQTFADNSVSIKSHPSMKIQ